MEDQKKFSLVEIVLGCLLLIPLDIASIILDSFSLDLGWVIQNPAWLIVAFYFTMKGAKATASLDKRFLMPIAVQFIPDFLLPFQLTILFVVTIYIENHPEKFAALHAAAGAAKGKAPKRRKFSFKKARAPQGAAEAYA